MDSLAASSPARQYRALTVDAGFVSLGHRTQIELTGADRAKLLQNLCTNDILGVGPGDGCEAFVTSAQGRVLGHVFVFCGEDSLVVETVAGAGEPLCAHLDKGCYLGQEPVARIDAVGHVNWRLRGLHFSATNVPADGTELKFGEKTVGRVTSAVYSPCLKAALAMGYVRRERSAAGTQLDSTIGAARVVDLPVGDVG
jgi:folate-binding Fe-S cluster repair protein YgfZ